MAPWSLPRKPAAGWCRWTRARGRRGGGGQLLCLLAGGLTRVVRVFYGLPLTLKENGAEDV